MEHRVTREECASRISGVCSRCGGKLEPIETVDNAENPTYWSGCKECERFEGGVPREVYLTAKGLVKGCGYRPYSHLSDDVGDSVGMRKYKNESQVSGTCDLVRDVLRIHGRVVAGEKL